MLGWSFYLDRVELLRHRGYNYRKWPGIRNVYLWSVHHAQRGDHTPYLSRDQHTQLVNLNLLLGSHLHLNAAFYALASADCPQVFHTIKHLSHNPEAPNPLGDGLFSRRSDHFTAIHQQEVATSGRASTVLQDLIET